MSTPDVAGLIDVVQVLRSWQQDGMPIQLHPGDLGWFWRFGADAMAAAVAVTAWSAGEGRPGLIEPLGVDPDLRGHGYGRAITIAAAAALRTLGASSAIVCTPSANVGAVATYQSAGFHQDSDVRDLRRPDGAGDDFPGRAPSDTL
jgi:ribosomal protein S18 acetylase RimI-like enzyme